MTLTTTKLIGHDYLVSGTDARGVAGETVLDGTEWDHFKLELDRINAVDAIDEAIESFFAPLVAALDNAASVGQHETVDPLRYFVVSEGEEGKPATRRQVVEFNDNTIVLRALAEGHHNRVIWVGDKLVVTAQPVGATSTPAPEVTPDDEKVGGTDD